MAFDSRIFYIPIPKISQAIVAILLRKYTSLDLGGSTVALIHGLYGNCSFLGNSRMVHLLVFKENEKDENTFTVFGKTEVNGSLSFPERKVKDETTLRISYKYHFPEKP